MSATAFQRRRRELAKKQEQHHLSSTEDYSVPVNTDYPSSSVGYTVKELREMCKDRGLTGYSKKSEAELIEMLKESGE